jgi:hypothetical protein
MAMLQASHLLIMSSICGWYVITRAFIISFFLKIENTQKEVKMGWMLAKFPKNRNPPGDS